MKLFSRIVFALCFALILLTIPLAIVHAQASEPGQPAQLPKLSADLLVTLTGSLLSIICYLVPPIQRWLTNSLGEWTALFMAGILLIVAGAYQFLWCAWGWACFVTNWQTTLLIWGSAVGANFAAYKAVVKPAKDRAQAQAELANRLPLSSEYFK